MGFFLCKSLGVLSLLAAAFALLSCRGLWLQEYSAWFVAVPLSISMIFAGLGVILLLLPAKAASNSHSFLMIRVTIVATTFGGIVLTRYFHGDTAEDRAGINQLWWTLGKMGIPLLLGGIFFVLSILTQKFKSKSKEPKT